MDKELNVKEYALTGMAVRDFTAVESALSVIGGSLDALIGTNNVDDFTAAAGDLYLKLTTLQSEVNYFVNDVNNFFLGSEGGDSLDQ